MSAQGRYGSAAVLWSSLLAVALLLAPTIEAGAACLGCPPVLQVAPRDNNPSTATIANSGSVFSQMTNLIEAQPQTGDINTVFDITQGTADVIGIGRAAAPIDSAVNAIANKTGSLEISEHFSKISNGCPHSGRAF